ncbi:glycoside hydrolase family 92 protein [Exidia glandulosa HHB12029]|uniref:Glycoside hydrolase family 92 protein n=1 Tax=Exidia glandulosa HHB12029 TaxID=1314781 RepID=A0A165JM82_EXIGL|nr:glycoside hydrolase family 92 protein [Exidia glandulosa HHB12029]
MFGAVLILAAAAVTVTVHAQPSPDVQKGIAKAIKNAKNGGKVTDFTAFVNPFIGTDNFGDVCPGASVPFGMVKVTTDNTGYAPAGYVADNTQFIQGVSPLHDSGTGSSLGSYGNFKIMPQFCPGGFNTCKTILSQRQRLRKNNTDFASPGYFAQTLDNDIKIEATATRRAALERFTFPEGTPFFSVDLGNDSPLSFGGGSLDFDPAAGRIKIGGRWRPSFGPSLFFYQAFACYDILDNGKQTLGEFGVWTADNFGMDAKALGQTHLNLSINLIGSSPYQSGALFSLAGNPSEVNIRVGVSFVSADQACQNAETEIGMSSFEEIQDLAVSQWNDKLSRIELDVARSAPNITEIFYSSYYRSFLTPNNATGEGSGAFAGTTSPYFDSLYCSWDTFRTWAPLLSLTSPVDYAEVVENYIDGWRKNGVIPECRSNQLPGWTQGGSDGTNILADFAVKYHAEAASLGVDLNEMFTALLSDGEENPPEWNTGGRQINVYKAHGFVPFAAFDATSTGRQTREGSRTLEYAMNDFGIRQVAQVLGHADEVTTYTNRSTWFKNVWDPTVKSDGFEGFMQKRFGNGTFKNLNPVDCSPLDTNSSRACSLTQDNQNGFYESSSWEYSFFAPQDMATLVDLMGGNETFVKRLDHFFNKGYYLAGNEPSFGTPSAYHYADHPAKSVQRGRQVLFENFDITAGGLPGNDDQAAMATFAAFHILGLFPIPSTTQFLIISPFVPSYTVHNPHLGVSTTVTVDGFDPASVKRNIPDGAAAYVANVTVNGVPSVTGRCFIDFFDTFKKGGNITITVTSNMDEADSCEGSLPDSLSTGGWASAR